MIRDMILEEISSLYPANWYEAPTLSYESIWGMNNRFAFVTVRGYVDADLLPEKLQAEGRELAENGFPVLIERYKVTFDARGIDGGDVIDVKFMSFAVAAEMESAPC